MKKRRGEAFSDGVLAIIVTIMVLGLKMPDGAEWHDLATLLPKFLSYILSFMMILIYWNNHHHVFQTVDKVNGNILLANGALLFFLSLVPFATAWMGENHFASKPVALMGIIFFLCGVSYLLLTQTIIRSHGEKSVLAQAMGNNFKGTVSWGGYLLAVAIAFFYPLVSASIYLVIALIWFIPDKRIERLIEGEK
jgi:uncharacterized membrane protein